MISSCSGALGLPNSSERADDSIFRKSKVRHVTDFFQSKEVTYLLRALKNAL